MLRARRGFRAGPWLTAKAALINDYCRASGLRACVVGVSGGVDSAVVLGLLRNASRQPGSPLRRLVAALLPLQIAEGVTGQTTATARGRLAAEAFAAERVEIGLAPAYEAMRQAAEAGLGVRGGAWAAGQLASNIRAPALYYLATLLTQAGAPAIVCGTTNRDEGGYIGFFGKASDGMVDLQPLADLHKREVFELARALDVPAEIREATPTGDTFDGRVDEEMIGAPYDFVELFQLLRAQLDDDARARALAELGPDARRQLERWSARLETLHAHNAHKYIAGAPAVFLDVLPRAVPGGWREAVRPGVPATSLAGAAIVGRFQLDPATADELRARPLVPNTCSKEHVFEVPAAGPSARLIAGVLDAPARARLRAALADVDWVPVGVDGRRDPDVPGRAPASSWRATAHDEPLARALWDRLRAAIPPVRCFDTDENADAGDHRVWRAVGLNPLLRFIRYEPGGRLIPHHDAGFDFGDGHHHTLMSVLLYLSEHDDDGSGDDDGDDGDGSGDGSGATRFILDPERHEPARARDYADWTRAPSPRELLAVVTPRPGAALIFDHRALHDGAPWAGPGDKLVLRTDIVFRRCGALAIAPTRSSSVSLPPLWGALGLAPGASRAEVDAAYAARVDVVDDDPERAATLRAAWTLLRDPIYARAYTRLGTWAAAEEAGFFDDGGAFEHRVDPRGDPRWLTTPLHRALARLADARAAGAEPDALAVLVTTGALCPVHDGHVAMMNIARRALERRGVTVLAGYLAPDHDAYVGPKRGAAALPAACRVRRCERAARATDWLMVDPWPALHCDRARNFTDVITRLEAYLSKHVPTATSIRVVYVFGGDNARFALAFAGRGHAVCVPRPGHEATLRRYADDPRVRDNPRVIIVEGESAPAIASRELPPPERAAPGRARLFLRDEGDWALAPWLARVAGPERDALRRARARFQEALLAALRRSFAAARWPERARALVIERLELDPLAPRERAAAELGARLLSLDACRPAAHNLAVSRGYTLCDGRRARELVARPGAPPLAEQLAALPAGDYVLIDDDLVSGETLARVRRALPERCRLVGAEFQRRLDMPDKSCPRDDPGDDARVVDLCDARDFLVGAREGGLVVELPDGQLARAPYLLPYVRPGARVSLPRASELEFSRALWTANLAFFRRVATLRVQDASAAFQRLARYLGFADETPLRDLCQWHVDRLAGSTDAAREDR